MQRSSWPVEGWTPTSTFQTHYFSYNTDPTQPTDEIPWSPHLTLTIPRLHSYDLVNEVDNDTVVMAYLKLWAVI